VVVVSAFVVGAFLGVSFLVSTTFTTVSPEFSDENNERRVVK